MTVATISDLTFQREALGDLLADLAPLLVAHWREVSPYHDLPIKPDLGVYLNAEAGGFLRVFTARNDIGALMGYAIFLVMISPQYGVKSAKHEVLYLVPTARAGLTGLNFIAWCDVRLKAEGVEMVTHTVRPNLNFSPLLARLGYSQTGSDYTRRLDKE